MVKLRKLLLDLTLQENESERWRFLKQMEKMSRHSSEVSPAACMVFSSLYVAQRTAILYSCCEGSLPVRAAALRLLMRGMTDSIVESAWIGRKEMLSEERTTQHVQQ